MLSKNFISALFISLSALSQSSITYAEKIEQHSISSTPITLQVDKEHHITLDKWQYIQKLEIDASGIRREGMFEVLVNNTVKGTIHVPGTDPRYIVTIAETANKITLKHISGANILIDQITAYIDVDFSKEPEDFILGNIGFEGRSMAAKICKDIIDLTWKLEPKVSAHHFERYILPIKIAATRSYASAAASGDLSRKLYENLVALRYQIYYADEFVNYAIGDRETYDLMLNLLIQRETLSELMD